MSPVPAVTERVTRKSVMLLIPYTLSTLASVTLQWVALIRVDSVWTCNHMTRVEAFRVNLYQAWVSVVNTVEHTEQPWMPV